MTQSISVVIPELSLSHRVDLGRHWSWSCQAFGPWTVGTHSLTFPILSYCPSLLGANSCRVILKPWKVTRCSQLPTPRCSRVHRRLGTSSASSRGTAVSWPRRDTRALEWGLCRVSLIITKSWRFFQFQFFPQGELITWPLRKSAPSLGPAVGIEMTGIAIPRDSAPGS